MKIIIPSANAANLVACVKALADSEAGQHEILAVDDGARADAPRHLGVTWIEGVKPFVFSRNVNLGIQAAGSDDVVLLNDDAFVWRGSLSALAAEANEHRALGICSAGTIGTVCNANQRPLLCHCGGQRSHVHPNARPERRMLAFICVVIKRKVIDAIGLLDERFVDYGYDDDDYCRRARHAGFTLGVSDACIVSHEGTPTFRSRDGWERLMGKNARLFNEKWS